MQGINIVDIIILITVGLTCYGAYKKGFLLTLYKVVSFFLAMIIAWLVNPLIKTTLVKCTNIQEWISEAIRKSLESDKTQALLVNTVEEKQIAVNNMSLPGFVKDALIKKVAEDTTNNPFLDFITESLTNICISIISYVLVILVVLIILSLIKGVLTIISNIPIIGSLNKILGLAFGILLASLRIWLVFLIIGLFSKIDNPGFIVKSINESIIGGWYYNNNVVSYIIMSMLS